MKIKRINLQICRSFHLPNRKYILSLLFILFFYSQTTWSAFSQRRCMLLPIKDSVSGAIGYKVFEQVEVFLKEGQWCFYETNSGILDILSNYKRNLDTYLENKDVLRTIAEKSHAGSLIKITVTNVMKGVDVKVKVIAEDGEDVYFREETRLDSDDPIIIAQTVKNWLDIYEKSIPYDGRVIGVLGDQFTTDVGRGYGAFSQNSVQIVRPIKKKKHPLLREIVDWQTQIIGTGKLFHVSSSQSQGNITQYENRKKARVDDWVILIKTEKEKNKKTKEEYYNEINEHSFGKHGVIGLYASLGTGSNTIVDVSTKKMGGLAFGVGVIGEIWATRDWWGSLEIGRKFASYSKEEGVFTSESNTLSGSVFKMKAGYKYLPLGFFYGPQIDGYIGYASYSYGFDGSVSDKISGVTFSGVLFGVKGSLPIHKLVKLSIVLDFIFNPGLEQDINLFGAADSTSNYHMEIAGDYVYSPSVTYKLGVGYTTSSANFKTGSRSINLKNTDFNVGAIFSF
jgi:hypothetical protein